MQRRDRNRPRPVGRCVALASLAVLCVSNLVRLHCSLNRPRADSDRGLPGRWASQLASLRCSRIDYRASRIAGESGYTPHATSIVASAINTTEFQMCIEFK